MNEVPTLMSPAVAGNSLGAGAACREHSVSIARRIADQAAASAEAHRGLAEQLEKNPPPPTAEEVIWKYLLGHKQDRFY